MLIRASRCYGALRQPLERQPSASIPNNGASLYSKRIDHLPRRRRPGRTDHSGGNGIATAGANQYRVRAIQTSHRRTGRESRYRRCRTGTVRRSVLCPGRAGFRAERAAGATMTARHSTKAGAEKLGHYVEHIYDGC